MAGGTHDPGDVEERGAEREDSVTDSSYPEESSSSEREAGKPLPIDQHDQFVMLVIDSQQRLFAYTLSLVLDRERARDIVQQTNLVLLEKEADFRHGTDFFAWAARVAYYEVLADRRRRYRDRHLFSDDLLAMIAEESSKIAGALEDRAEALQLCLRKLSGEHRDLLLQRYRPGGSVAAIAESMGKTPGAISAVLHRLRAGLVDCVERRLRELSRP
ncbi:sigma-70 family RNA polymerase sigma factor [Botrimarina hoheduenensis]|uniref:RNA polymerase sigma factor SigL n=1 Tax=Botrimarina hoheduenensis TaxID=2528000 RepID=A0A5C5VWJ0_9BACT|nr:sigma-70 family RNA polymerase sigma factor [Botrimarina hoheduenensis]TWT42894.1 RNA polymerase sigma factor SigL [Botrimarina hoheduenensis]